ncbi:MAG: hypothetical protein ACOC1Z_01645 [Cyanobacteriota bacterium]
MTGLTSLGIRYRGQPLTVVRPSRSPLIPNLNPQQLIPFRKSQPPFIPPNPPLKGGNNGLVCSTNS